MACEPSGFPKKINVGDLSLTARPFEEKDLPTIAAFITPSPPETFFADDVQRKLEQNPGQMFGLFDDSERLLSTCTGTKLSDEDAYISLFETEDKYQRRGLGSAVFNITMSSLGERNVLLFATQSNSSIYKKFGFGVMDQETLLSCDGRLKPRASKPPREDAQERTVQIESVDKATVETVSGYEGRIFNLNRPVWFSTMLSVPSAYCFRAVSGDGTVVGCILARTRDKHLIVSSLCADDITTAKALWGALMNAVGESCETVAMYMPYWAYEEFASVVQHNIDGNLSTGSRIYCIATSRLPPIEWKKVFVFHTQLLSTTK